MMKIGLRVVTRCVVVLLSMALIACTKVNSGVGGMFDFDTDLQLVFEVAEHINPDEKHRPSPVFIRFYELKSNKAFEQADFLALYENDEALLGKDLLAKRELERIVPGEGRSEHFVVDPETRYVALFAEFFEFRNARYKVVFPVTSSNVVGNKVRIELKDNQLKVLGTR